MDVRKRQLVGYLTAAAVVLAIATGFGVGYALGYGAVAGGDQAIPPRPLPENVCALIPKDTRNRTVPWPGQAKLGGNNGGTEQVNATCELTTDLAIAQTYNEASLKVRVDRFGSMGMTSRSEAAEKAMKQITEQAGDAAKPVRNLGDQALVTSRKRGPHHWDISVRVQYGDTLVAIDYSTRLADGGDTKSAALAVTREVLAGLS